jgi:hypothetical protein
MTKPSLFVKQSITGMLSRPQHAHVAGRVNIFTIAKHCNLLSTCMFLLYLSIETREQTTAASIQRNITLDSISIYSVQTYMVLLPVIRLSMLCLE